MSDPVRDQRFQKVHNDPRFARNSKRKNKLQIDKRFAGALKDERFQSVQGKYDKYGRRIEKRENELKKFYRLEDEEDADAAASDEEKDEAAAKEDAQTKGPSTTSSSDDNDEADATVAKNKEKLSRLDYLNAMARGELASDSDSSDSDSGAEEEDEDVAEQEEQEDIPMGEETKRFAVLNCDWTRIRAVDLFALCQSFAPATGAVQNVTIYPSDYGLQKMKEEAEHGPQGLWDDEEEGKREERVTETHAEDEEKSEVVTSDIEENEENEEKIGGDDEDSESDVEGEDGYDSDDPLGVKKSVTLDGESDGFDREKLRKYELQKLRYYYAVVTCDSVKTASTIFDQCDQLEYETSSNVLDLRYVPDDVTFTNTPKESCDSVPDRYKPAIFATLALQQTDVKLTWEEDDEQRLELLTRPADWKDADDDDFKAYLASDVSDASDNDNDDSDDSEAEQDADDKTDGAAPDSKKESKKAAKIKKLRNRYRSMLLGSDAEDEGDDDDAAAGGFGSSSDGGEDDAEGDMEMSFTPGASDVLKAKRQKELEANETPFERYTREKKQEKNRKLHEKRTKQKQLEREQREVLKKKGRGSKEANLLREAINGGGDGSDGDDSDSDNDERNFDMKKIAKQEKAKSLKGKRRAKEMRKLTKQKASGGLQEGFEFDAADPRFGALYAKGSQFQLDPTDPKFRKTDATQAIFKERRQRYDQEAVSATQANESKPAASDNGKSSLNAMVENLKRKSQQQDKKKAKKQKKSKA
ncbi:pre-rRNA-processing protein esf1 [Phytophthora boehmeriae]|uniref:Pre-rRNA-processing protein esf1 n=1 Tax=Phytophthora boehmeriae TaxID=109152 RepID=A0A8T1WWF7_9STRA|nr:pre-rRNA-processing protein esf1 [Phytophthora boehmeriae]